MKNDLGFQRDVIPLAGVQGDFPRGGEMSRSDRGDGHRLGAEPPVTYMSSQMRLENATGSVTGMPSISSA